MSGLDDRGSEKGNQGKNLVLKGTPISFTNFRCSCPSEGFGILPPIGGQVLCILSQGLFLASRTPAEHADLRASVGLSMLI